MTPSRKSPAGPPRPEPRLERELFVKPVVEAPAQCLFGQPVGRGRPCEMGGAGLHRGGEIAVGNRLPDHPPRRGLLAVTGSAKSTAPIARAKPICRGSQ